ncbi:hypothetical protein [uncultured Cellulomonas sp.]|uniref:hypothetical protein n=1 Tax=uncultured Cellulomonas sp. TaxID=189682 RepID=UPI00262535E7|nr:hypothetical protein [uncultured Cellulomonas sp.]
MAASLAAAATGLAQPTTPSDPLPVPANPGSLTTNIDPRLFRESVDGPPPTGSKVQAIASSTDGLTYLALGSDQGESEVWYVDPQNRSARRLPMNQEVGAITSMEALNVQPDQGDFSRAVSVSAADPGRALWLGSSTGLYQAGVTLPLGPGAEGSLSVTKATLPDDASATLGPIEDFAEGSDSTLFMSGPLGKSTLSAVRPVTSGGVVSGSNFEPSVLPDAIGLADAAGARIISSGRPVALDGVLKIAASHAGELALLDQSGRRIVAVDGQTTSVLYEVLPEDESIRDLEYDELGNLYWTTVDGVHRMDPMGAVDHIVPSRAPSVEKAGDYHIPDPGVLEIASDGALLVAADGDLSVTSVRSVTNLESSATRELNFRSWISERPVSLDVVAFCSCQSTVADDRSFFKIKLGLDASGATAPADLDPERFYLMGLVAGGATLEYEIPAQSDDGGIVGELWSGRELVVAEATQAVVLDSMQTVTVNGTPYGLYAFPANPRDVVVVAPDESTMSFATELPEASIAPGSRFYDERKGYGSLVFDVPRTGASGARIRVIPVAIGYADDDRWRAFSELTDWGAPDIPWNF